MKALEAPYTASNGAGITAAMEEVNRMRPLPRAAMSLTTRLARCTVETTFRLMRLSSSFKSVSG